MTRPSERLRLCHVTLGLEVGGQERALLGLLENIDRSRFDVTVVSLTSRGALADRLEKAGARVIALEQRDGVRPFTLLKLARLFRRGRFSIVHSHDDRPLAYAIFASVLGGVPLRVHTHHHGEWGRMSLGGRLWLGLAARFVDRFVCVSRQSAEYLKKQRIAPSSTEVIPNGVDLRRFSYNGPVAGGPIVCVARLSQEKGHGTLLAAFSEAAASQPTLELWLAGDGPDFEALNAYAQNLGLSGRVQFLGMVEDVPALLRKAALFVLASTTEGLPLTLLEAMATGLPVIATDVGGNAEVIETGKSGILVPPGDPHRLAQAILEQIGDEEGAKGLGVTARGHIERRFSLADVSRRYETLYGALLHASSRPAQSLLGRDRC